MTYLTSICIHAAAELLTSLLLPSMAYMENASSLPLSIYEWKVVSTNGGACLCVCMYSYMYVHFTCFLKNTSCVQLHSSEMILEFYLKMSLRTGNAASLSCL